MAGTEMLEALGDDLGKDGIRLRVVEARSAVRDMLRKEGLGEKLGPFDRRTSLAEVVAGFAG
jgi:hypothetical protein